MDRDTQQRIARNEAVFRDVNEAIETGRWPGEEDAPVPFRCECGRLGCSRLIDIKVAEYERVRAHPRRFVVALEHDIPDIESIVESHRGYVVVEKRGEAGRLAVASDPRS